MGVYSSDHVNGCGMEISFKYLFGVASNAIFLQWPLPQLFSAAWEVGMGHCSVKEVLLNGETQYR